MIATNNHRQLTPQTESTSQAATVHDAIATLTFGKLGWLSFQHFLHIPPEDAMKTTAYFDSALLSPRTFRYQQAQDSTPLGPLNNAESRPPREEVRHILLGSPGAIRQTIHLLHALNYAEPPAWSQLVTVGEQLIITPEQGESMSLLRRPLTQF